MRIFRKKPKKPEPVRLEKLQQLSSPDIQLFVETSVIEAGHILSGVKHLSGDELSMAMHTIDVHLRDALMGMDELLARSEISISTL